MSVLYIGNYKKKIYKYYCYYIYIFNYRDLYFWKEVRTKTIDNFEKTKMSMMYVCRNSVAKDLHLRD